MSPIDSLRRRALALVLLACAASHVNAQISEELVSVASNALPNGQSDAEVAAILEGRVSTSNGTALAVLVAQPGASLILVFIRQANGSYLAADASVIESAIFGGFGRPRTDYERYESEILELEQRDDGLYRLRVRTRAWRMWQRYTGGDFILIRPDGTVLQR